MTRKEAEAYAQDNDMVYSEVNVRTDEGVKIIKNAFYDIATLVMVSSLPLVSDWLCHAKSLLVVKLLPQQTRGIGCLQALAIFLEFPFFCMRLE